MQKDPSIHLYIYEVISASCEHSTLQNGSQQASFE